MGRLKPRTCSRQVRGFASLCPKIPVACSWDPGLRFAMLRLAVLAWSGTVPLTTTAGSYFHRRTSQTS